MDARRPPPCRPSPSSAASPPSPASTSTSAPGRSSTCQGPNGAGKTTLLRACAGLVAVSRGRGRGARPRPPPRPPGGAPPRRAARPRAASSTTTSPSPTTSASRCAAGGGPTDAVDATLAPPRPRRAAARRRRRPALGRPAPADRAGRARGPRPELWLLDEPHAGPRRRRPRPPRRRRRERRRRRRHGDRRVARARPGRRHRRRQLTIAGGQVHETGAPPCARDASLVAGKDLRIEARSRVATNQVAPVRRARARAVRLRPRPRPRRARPGPRAGLFWVAVLFCALLAIQRSFAIESADGARDGLRLSGLDPAGIFLGKAGAVAVAAAGPRGAARRRRRPALRRRAPAAPCCSPSPPSPPPLGLAAAGTVYGVLAAGLRVRETLLPLLLLPVVAPVLLGATRASEAALGHGDAGDGVAVGPAARRVRRRSTSPFGVARLRPPAGGRHDRRSTTPDGLLGIAALVTLGDDGRPRARAAADRRSRASTSRLIAIHPPIAWAAYLAFGRHARSAACCASCRAPAPACGTSLAGVVGRDRRRVHRADAGHRLDLGPPDVGRVVGVGRPAHAVGADAGAVPRLPGAAAGAGRRRRTRAKRAPSPRCSPSLVVPVNHFAVEWWRTLHQGSR